MSESEQFEPIRVWAGRLRRDVDGCMLADRRGLLRRIRRLKGRLGRRGLVLWAATDAVVGETVLVHVLVVPDIPSVKDDR